MKKLMSLIVLTSVVSFVSIIADAHATEEFTQVNPVLQSAVDSITKGDEWVNDFQIKFDESFSSVELNRIKYDLSGSVRNTPWALDAGSSLSSSTTLQADQTGIVALVTVEVKTDVLAFFRYAADQALEKIKTAVNSDKNEVAYLERLSKAASLDELKELLVSYQDFIQGKLKSEIESETDQSKAKRLEKILKVANGFGITSENDGSSVRKITISHPEISREFKGEFKRGARLLGFSLELGADTVRLQVSGLATVPEKELNNLKSELKKHLGDIQKNGSFEDQENVQSKLRQALVEFKKTVSR